MLPDTDKHKTISYKQKPDFRFKFLESSHLEGGENGLRRDPAPNARGPLPAAPLSCPTALGSHRENSFSRWSLSPATWLPSSTQDSDSQGECGQGMPA